MAREYNRMIGRAVREIDRKEVSLKNEVKILLAEIKQAAKMNQLNSANILAQNLVCLKNEITKLCAMSSQLKKVGIKLSTMNSTLAINKIMTGVIAVLNKRLDLPKTNNMIQEFCKANRHVEMTSEIMSNAKDISFEDLEAADNVMNEFFSEMDIQVKEEMDVNHRPGVKQEESKEFCMSDLELRFRNLK